MLRFASAFGSKITLLGWMSLTLAWGQSSPGAFLGETPSKDNRRIVKEVRPPALELNLPDPDAIRLSAPSTEELRAKARGLARHAGFVRKVSVSPDKMEFTQLPDGSRDGRFTIESKTARRLRLRFQNFDAAGGRVWVYNADRSQVSGPYTDKGPFGDGDFWTEPIRGERAIVEWAGAPAGQLKPIFELTDVAHIWPVNEKADSERANNDDPACHSSLANASKAVASLDIISEDGGVWYCSGALLNTSRTEYAPLFLTANHCVQSDKEARTVAAFWNYAKTACDKDELPPDRESAPSTLGARLLASLNGSHGDFTLLKLNGVPAGAFALGWTTTEPAVDGKFVGVHHPGLPPQNYQRVTFGHRGYDRQEILYIGEQYNGDAMVPQNLYLQAFWDYPSTAGGSSGSPLLNDNSQVIGVLSYCWAIVGDPQCLITEPNGYGRFSYIYPLVREFFEVIPPPGVTVSARQFSFKTVDGKAQQPARQSLQISTNSTTDVPWRFAPAAGWLTASQTSGVVRAGAPVTIEVFAAPPVNLAAGTYRTTAAVHVGSAAPVSVSADLTAEVRNPVITFRVVPNPVVEREYDRDGNNFDFTLELEETAGIEARLTQLTLDGQVANSMIREFFKTDVLPGKGKISATFSARIEPSADVERVFEIGGYVPSTAQQWRATAKAKFLPRSK